MTHPNGIIMPLSPSGVPFPWAARQGAEGVAARREGPAEVKQLTYALEAYGTDKSTIFLLESRHSWLYQPGMSWIFRA